MLYDAGVTDIWIWLGVLLPLLVFCSWGCAVHALMSVRTSQGAIAWALFLITLPFLGLPAYLIFGRNKFRGYADARKSGCPQIERVVHEFQVHGPDHLAEFDPEEESYKAFEAMTRLPLTTHNDVQLLVDGEATFDAIFSAIESATEYVLVQFFIIHADHLGEFLRELLERKSREGVRVYVLYDEIGSHDLPRRYLMSLADAGVKACPFGTTKGFWNKFQLNFRNHRKVVVVDGVHAFVGGHNVGDEYMGRSKRFGHWRDTHVRVSGPAALCCQWSFVEDWYWANGDILDLRWAPTVLPGATKRTMVIPSGPVDDIETCNLLFVHAIHSAQKELWISSPYFVPDEEMVGALQLAALRGVDVRILLPARADHLMVFMASFAFLEALDLPGISIYRYEPGFLHQKVILADEIGIVGTANADNRSFRLNFEISMLFPDQDMAQQVRAMLEADFAKSRLTDVKDYLQAPFHFRLGVRIARLFAPVL